MGEAKRRKELGIAPRDIKKTNKIKNSNLLNETLNKYPYLPFIIGALLLAILVFDLANYYL